MVFFVSQLSVIIDIRYGCCYNITVVLAILFRPLLKCLWWWWFKIQIQIYLPT